MDSNGTVWSFSRLELFADPLRGCPRRYYHRYVERRPEPPTPAHERGRIVHALISTCLREGKRPHDVLSLIPGTDALDEEGRQEVLDMASGYLRAEHPAGAFRTEEKLEAVLANGERFLGYADLIEPGAIPRITDFKTSWEKHGPTDTWQLPLYAWMLAEKLGVERVRVRLWFLRYRKEPAVEAVVGPREMEAAVAWAEEVVARIREAESGPLWACFPPQPGTVCSSCGFSLECLGVDLGSEPPAEEIAGLILRLERALTCCREELEKRIKQSGPIFVRGQHFGFYPRSRWIFPDVGAFAELLRGAGKDPWKYLELPGWKLAPLLRGPLGEKLRAMGQEVREEYLTHRDNPP